MSDSIINVKILRKCGGELEHDIKVRCLEPCSKEDYINAMEDIITRKEIGKTCTRGPVESKMVSKTSREDKRPERPVLKCHKHDPIDVLYTYKNAFPSENEPLGAIKGHEVDITLNMDRPYPPVLRRPAYPASPRARQALEKDIQELVQLGVLRKVGHNEEV
ncbi:hypothetical protein O181_062707 [Austropuccinia psidii MF-1]|uniref:Reverse transcriptase domain-containing protein n=1 Tax=Austropuccinia psidii MF-1 TaxID=1389203 RepID=A0A9Q3ESM6_9BASI|nr:hypothetical protein [Austropuccinia psidii MF-1]